MIAVVSILLTIANTLALSTYTTWKGTDSHISVSVNTGSGSFIVSSGGEFAKGNSGVNTDGNSFSGYVNSLTVHGGGTSVSGNTGETNGVTSNSGSSGFMMTSQSLQTSYSGIAYSGSFVGTSHGGLSIIGSDGTGIVNYNSGFSGRFNQNVCINTWGC